VLIKPARFVSFAAQWLLIRLSVDRFATALEEIAGGSAAA
jgi:hypothetical protein